MDMTVGELAEILDPAVTDRQIRAVIFLAGIQHTGFRRSPRAGKPARTYNRNLVAAAHAQESSRTSRPFEDSDWVSHALIGRALVTVDIHAGIIRWLPDGGRAEVLGTGNYGWVHAGPIMVPAHRVIWIASEGEIPPCMQVNHINKLRWDNRRANLELTSQSENLRHMHGLHYLTRDAAIRELNALEPPEEPDPWKDLMRAPGAPVTGPPGMAVKSQVARSRVRRH